MADTAHRTLIHFAEPATLDASRLCSTDRDLVSGRDINPSDRDHERYIRRISTLAANLEDYATEALADMGADVARKPAISSKEPMQGLAEMHINLARAAKASPRCLLESTVLRQAFMLVCDEAGLL